MDFTKPLAVIYPSTGAILTRRSVLSMAVYQPRTSCLGTVAPKTGWCVGSRSSRFQIALNLYRLVLGTRGGRSLSTPLTAWKRFEALSFSCSYISVLLLPPETSLRFLGPPLSYHKIMACHLEIPHSRYSTQDRT